MINKNVGKGLLLSTAAIAAASCSNASVQEKPNILLIVADDLGLGDVSCYGSETISTPNIDRLAEEGVCFDNAYATSATSTPSRYAMFTGLYPWRNSDAKILPGDANLLIDPNMPTMPKMLQAEGYQSAAIGKWHLGMGSGKVDWNEHIEPSGNKVGFDFTNLIPATVDRVPTVYVENGDVVGLNKDNPIYVDYDKKFPGEPNGIDNPELMKMKWLYGHQGTIINGIPRIGHMIGGEEARWDDETMADYFLSKAKHFLDSRDKTKPFFLYYGLHEPHVPRTPAKRFQGVSGLGCRGDVVVEADWCVGEIVSYLDSLGVLENTLVIITSDNGAVLQDGYDDMAEQIANEKHHDPDNGLRGGKYSLYDAGTHVPFITYWKGKIKPARSKAYVCLMDLYASFADLLGAKVPENLDSQNYIDALLGKDLKDGRENQILEAQGRLAYRKGHYVMIPPYSGINYNSTGIELGNNSYYSLWDLEKDPKQTSNLAESHPELLETMKEEFSNIVNETYNQDIEVEALK